MISKFNMHYFNKKYILFLFLSLNLIFFSTIKVQANSFEINNIEISKPFENNFNKRTVIDKGFKEAFLELVSSLIKSDDQTKIKNVKLNEIKSMIDSFSIKEEKFINQTYYVNLGVSFNKKKIFKFLEKKNIFPSQIIREDFLFIPIIIDENINNLTIFSDNQIYSDWNKKIKRHHLINYILPTEDIEDLELIKRKYNSIENYDFQEIIKKYFLDNCIVTLIFKDGQEIRILSKIILKDKVIIRNESFPKFNLNNEKKIETLIEKLKLSYEDVWKELNQINTSIKLTLTIKVDNQNSKKLLEFEKILSKLDLVNFYSIKKFDNENTFYEVIFNGTPINFINIMKDKNYVLDTQKKIWILK